MTYIMLPFDVSNDTGMVKGALQEYAGELIRKVECDHLGIGKMLKDKNSLPPDALISLLCGPSRFGDLLLQTDRAYRGRFLDANSYLKHIYECNGWRVIVDRMKDPDAFCDAALWASFWATVEGEQAFARSFLPFSSNEERLTGFFLASVLSHLDKYRDIYSALHAGSGSSFGVSVYDTATNNKEKTTGADFGLIVRSGSKDVLIKAARVQVKVAEYNEDGTLRFIASNSIPKNIQDDVNKEIRNMVDFDGIADDVAKDVFRQKKNLLKFSQLLVLSQTSDLGHYLCFIEGANEKAGEGSLGCVIVSADGVRKAVLDKLNDGEDAAGRYDPLDETMSPIPFFSFISLGMTGRETGYGVACGDSNSSEQDDIENAVHLLFGAENPPSYCMMVDVSPEPPSCDLRLAIKRVLGQRPKNKADSSEWSFAGRDGSPILPKEVERLMAEIVEQILGSHARLPKR